jgi:hypothetical protein
VLLLVAIVGLVGCTPGVIQIAADSDSSKLVESKPDSESPWVDTDPIESIPGFPDSDTDEGEDDTGVDPEDEVKYQAFFDIDVIQDIHIELTDDAIRDLNRDGSTYVSGNVVVNGERYDNVGVRLKGSSTYQDLNGKAAFKIKLNKFVPGTRYGTLERITLNNMLSDVSQSKEVIVYHLLQDAGQKASRANYAQVYLNDELFGLYTNLEASDDHWLERRYADATGNLWATAPSDADWTRNGLSKDRDGLYVYWDSQSGDGDQSRFEQLQDALSNRTGDWFADLDPHINTDQYLEFWAWSIVIGNQDGYPFHLNDVIVYENPENGGKLEFFPWGTDESYDTTALWYYVEGVLSTYCIEDPVCVQALYAKMNEVLAVYESLAVNEYTLAAHALSEQAVLDDPRRAWYYTVKDVSDYRALLLSTQTTWPDYVRTTQGL